MEKTITKNVLIVFGIVLMLATSPLDVIYTHAEEIQGSDKSTSECSKSSKIAKNLGKGVISEEIIDGKLKMTYHNFDQSASFDELQEFMLEDKTNGWAYVSGKAYDSGIVLYNGKVVQTDENTWNVSTEGIIDLDGKTLNLELDGTIHGTNVFLKGIASNDEFSYKVVFAGKTIVTDEDEFFGISFMKAELRDPETGQTIRIFVDQMEIINSENIKIEPELSRTVFSVA